MKIHWQHIYRFKEKIDINKKFWWEKLPIFKHLLTKRAFAKASDVRMDLLMDKLGYILEINKKGLFYLKKIKKGKK